MPNQGCVLDIESLDRGDLDLKALRALLSWRFYDATSPETLEARLAEVEIAVTNKVVIDAAAMAQAPRLRLICVAATGYNNVDIEAARKRGIAVCNVRDYATPSVVEHVFALILALSRRLLPYRDLIRAGAWQRSRQFSLLDHPIGELSGKTLGIIGHGTLGSAVARTAQAFGMQVVIAEHRGAEPRPGRTAFETVLREADVLSLHCPLTEATRGLIDRNALSLMKPTALLINTARGGIVEESALAQALREERLGGAGIDVLSTEPPVQGNPLLDASLPRLILTPHIAWASRESRQRLVDQLTQNIQAFLAGKPQNLIA